MKCSKLWKIFIELIFVAALAGILISNAPAAGTPAGTIIENTATATYKDINGNPLPPITSTVKIVIAQVCGVDVSPPAGSKNVLAGSSAYYPAAVTNTGNGNDTFDLTAVSSSGYVTGIYFDANGDGVLQDSEKKITNTPQLLADKIYSVIITLNIPPGTADGKEDTVTFTAKGRFGPCTDSGTYTANISDFVLTINKTVDNTTPLPGDTITYTITYSNTGKAEVRDLVITDPVPDKMTFIAGSIALNGVSQTDAVGDDKGGFSGNVVTASAGNVSSGKSGAVTFKVKIKDGVPSGTQLSNVATGDYKDEPGTRQPPLVIVGTPVIVGELCGVRVERSREKSGNPGDTVEFPFTITNTGNIPSLFNGNVTSTSGWSWAFYVDANGNGFIDAGDYTAIDNDGDGRLDTDVLNPGETKNYIAYAKVPPGTADGAIDTTTLTASAAKGNCSGSVTLKTNVSAPVLTIDKSVSPSDELKPGTIVTYTITVKNNGSGRAADIVVSDFIPANTTYIDNSVTVNGIKKTDAQDGDQVTFLAGSIVVKIGSLGPNGSATITFQVKIS